MATRLKKLRKAIKPSKAVEKLIYGDEPLWDNKKLKTPEFKLKLIHACNWYSYFIGNKKKKEWFLEYIINTESFTKTQLNFFKKIPDNFFGALGTFARIKSLGIILPEEVEISFNHRISVLQNLPIKTNNSPAPKIDPKKLIIQQYRKMPEIFGIIEFQIDKFVTEGFTNYDIVSDLMLQNIKKNQIDAIINYINKFHLIELKELYEGKNKELNQSYNFSRRNLKKLIKFLEITVEKCQNFSKKKQQIKKIKSNKQIIGDLKYLKKCSKLNIISINPEKIIKASELWVYDTIGRKIKLYKSSSASGLSIKGTNIIGFNKESSMKTIRKPEIFFKQLGNGGMKNINSLFVLIRGKELPLLSGRMNSKSIILRIF